MLQNSTSEEFTMPLSLETRIEITLVSLIEISEKILIKMIGPLSVPIVQVRPTTGYAGHIYAWNDSSLWGYVYDIYHIENLMLTDRPDAHPVTYGVGNIAPLNNIWNGIYTSGNEWRGERITRVGDISIGNNTYDYLSQCMW